LDGPDFGAEPDNKAMLDLTKPLFVLLTLAHFDLLCAFARNSFSTLLHPKAQADTEGAKKNDDQAIERKVA
jgi:hypothetical protein